jgi:glyoxylase I family protein
VEDLDSEIHRLLLLGVETEPVRIDPYTHKRFTFFSDPDELPLELYEDTSLGS